LRVDFDPSFVHLSPTGNRLTLAAKPKIVGGQARFKAAPPLDVWVLDLESDKQFKLFSFTGTDVTGTQGPWMNLIGWLRDE
jgi:hypothetical protein